MKYFNFYCPLCKKNRRQNILFSYLNDREDEIPTEYTLTECNSCREPGLFMREDAGMGFLPGIYFHLWRGEKRMLKAWVPRLVREYFDRCKKLEIKKEWNSLVLEVGKTLESICIDLYPEKKGLASALRHLRKNGIITGDLYDWADELRLTRNLQAHPTLVDFSEWEAKQTFDFLELIIDTIYRIKGDFEEFREQRKLMPTRRL